jgi:tetratricopeptide (TPR) repeat protein
MQRPGAGGLKMFPRMKKLWPVLLLFLGSCALTSPELGPEQRREIYQKVVAEIDQSRQRGDRFRRDGDYYQALTSYRQAAFFQPSSELTRRINELEEKIDKESATLYAQGQNQLSRDLPAALLAFNQALLLNPDHQQARQARDQLLRTPEMKAELTSRLTVLQRTWEDYPRQPETIASMAEQAEAVLALQHEHPLGREVKQFIARERRQGAHPYLAESRKLLAAGQLEQARLLARKARSIDPDNQEGLTLLREIQQRKDFLYFLNLSRFRLQNNDYEKAEEFARQALALAPECGETAALLNRIRMARLEQSLQQALHSFAAKKYEEAAVLLQQVMADGPLVHQWPELLKKIEKTLAMEVPRMMAEGKELFSENKLTEASRVLTCLLDLVPDHGEADTYLKKVQNRLQTIKSLQ